MINVEALIQLTATESQNGTSEEVKVFLYPDYPVYVGYPYALRQEYDVKNPLQILFDRKAHHKKKKSHLELIYPDTKQGREEAAWTALVLADHAIIYSVEAGDHPLFWQDRTIPHKGPQQIIKSSSLASLTVRIEGSLESLTPHIELSEGK